MVRQNCLHNYQLISQLLNAEGRSQSHFSLSEEARNTEHHHSWNSDLKLRNSSIAFISAGDSVAESLTQIPQGKSPVKGETSWDRTLEAVTEYDHSHHDESNIWYELPLQTMRLSDNPSDNVHIENPNVQGSSKTGYEGAQYEPASDGLFCPHTEGATQPLHTDLPPTETRRSSSPAASDSSGEIILFSGRSGFQTQKIFEESSDNDLKSELQGSKDPMRLRTHVPGLANSPTGPIIKHNFPAEETLSRDKAHPAIGTNKQSESKKERQQAAAASERPLSNRFKRHGEEQLNKANQKAEIMDDYIKNALGSDDLRDTFDFSRPNGGNSGSYSVRQRVDGKQEPSAVHSPLNKLKQSEEDWNSVNLHDLDEMSTSSEAPVAIKHILSKRERHSRAQYLVAGVGSTIDDARWLPVGLLRTSGADSKIYCFEEEQADTGQLSVENGDSEDSLSTEEYLAPDVQDQLDDLEDERDLEKMLKERMTDEQIAKLLAKQEELGLGSHDIVLLDGGDLAEPDVGDAQMDGTWGRPTSYLESFQSKRKKHRAPFAAAFADEIDQDPYNGFDVMDHDRPSIRKKSKGRRGQFLLKLSDSEMEQTINAAWENDRTKKKLRKQEREELRAQGLLGTKGKVDKKAKYKDGMTMDQVKAEIRGFLLSSAERCV